MVSTECRDFVKKMKLEGHTLTVEVLDNGWRKVTLDNGEVHWFDYDEREVKG